MLTRAPVAKQQMHVYAEGQRQSVTPEASTELPAASVIICTRGRPKMLAETVESILQAEEVPREIVILDQSPERHPTLPRIGFVRGCEIRYIQSQAIGLSRARNDAQYYTAQECDASKAP